MKKRFTLFFLFGILITSLESYTKDLEISKDFNIFTSKNAQGYFKPLITTLGESFNTGLFTTANYKNGWSISLDLGLTGMFIPNSQKTYDAELPDQFGNTETTETSELLNYGIRRNHNGTVSEPTIYGGISNPVFSSPQENAPPDTLYKTIGFMEGNNINFMTGLPVFQLSFGIPTRTLFKLKFATINIDDNKFLFYTIAINQNIDKLFGLFGEDESFAWALNFATHKLEYGSTFDMSSWSLGTHFSKTFDWGLTLYSGMQYENVSGSFYAVREINYSNTITNSAYKEIRDGAPLKFDLESDNSYRVLAGLSFRTGILELHSDIAWAAQPVVNAGISLWFLDTETKTEPYLPSMPAQAKSINTIALLQDFNYNSKISSLQFPVIPIPAEPSLSADIKIKGVIDNIEINTDKIIIEEFLSRQMRPLLPYIFFEDGSDQIQSKYAILDKSSTNKFTMQDLLGKNNLETYYQVLNIIAKRMNEMPNTKLTITGCNSNKGIEKNNKALSKNRAEKVKDYFVSNWGISSDRIDIKFGNKPKVPSNDKTIQGVEENRRVELSSEDWVLMAPIDINDTLRTITPPTLRFKPEIESEKGVKNWSVNIIAGEKQIKTINGTNKPKGNIDWFSEEHINSIRKYNSLDYKLSVTNEDGKTITTNTKSIPVEVLSIQKKRQMLTKDTVFNVYNLILFDFDKSKLDPVNKRITDVIKSEIPDNGLVQIFGYTDNMGDEKHNAKLSGARAKSTSTAIKAKNMASFGKGESELLFTNDIPEGRFLCRTVVVEVKIPVNN